MSPRKPKVSPSSAYNSPFRTDETFEEETEISPEDTNLFEIDHQIGTSEYAVVGIKKFEKKSAKQVKEFNELLVTLSSIEEKTKSLWKEIYSNAVYDRHNAHMMWINLYTHVYNNPTEHAIHGQNLSRYLERMNKANDQLLKLAQLVASAAENEAEETITEEDIYTKILNKPKGIS